jgi:hypothetical protein
MVYGASSSKPLKRHGRRERMTIDGSLTNREVMLSCAMVDRLQQRRTLKTDSNPPESRPQQSHRAGSPRRQMTSAADIGLQVNLAMLTEQLEGLAG